MFDSSEKETIDSLVVLQQTVLPKLQPLKDSISRVKLMEPYQALSAKFIAILAKPEVNKDLKQLRFQMLLTKELAAYSHSIDSLFSNQALKELLLTRRLFFVMDHNHIPLGEYGLQLANQKLTNPFLKDYILKADNYYRSLDGKQISYQASLKKTDHLKEAKNADLLFEQLIAPYKGKVIYVDFWGTWCRPCLAQMPYAATLKKELAGKDVIFMYLANNSPENTWTNVIKKMDLTGENVVQYRLPEEQQAMIERKFLVNSFPTYLLIGKDGQLISDKAPRPEQRQELLNEINKILK
jgi:thiol-disulfide isomerase/thioredoxin